MKYGNPIYVNGVMHTPLNINVDGMFDSFTMDVVQDVYPSMELTTKQYGMVNHLRPFFWLVSEYEEATTKVTQGDTLTFKVKQSQPHVADETYTLRMKLLASDFKAEYDYGVGIVKSVVETDMDLANGALNPTTLEYSFDITIPANKQEGVVSIPTNAVVASDTGFFFGDYKVGTVEVVNTSAETFFYPLEDEVDNHFVIEASEPYPEYYGQLALWAKVGKIGNLQPIEDPDTGEGSLFNLGYEVVDDGAGGQTYGDTLEGSKIIDDTPLSLIQFRPTDETIEFMNTEELTDITLHPPRYMVQIIPANRD